MAYKRTPLGPVSHLRCMTDSYLLACKAHPLLAVQLSQKIEPLNRDESSMVV